MNRNYQNDDKTITLGLWLQQQKTKKGYEQVKKYIVNESRPFCINIKKQKKKILKD